MSRSEVEPRNFSLSTRVLWYANKLERWSNEKSALLIFQPITLQVCSWNSRVDLRLVEILMFTPFQCKA